MERTLGLRWQQTPSQLYLVTRRDLHPGDGVPPGRWLARLGQADLENRQRKIEAVLEDVRRREFSGYPDRAKCCFACLSEGDALTFALNCGRLGYIYEVTVAAPKVFVADMRWFTEIGDAPGTAEQSARSYWAGLEHTGGALLEVLVPGGLTISCRLRKVG